MLADILSRHRGPYRFCITRPHPKKKGFHRSEWLKGAGIQPEDVGPEAISLIHDPRDTIELVGVWSERDQYFVTVIRTEKDL